MPQPTLLIDGYNLMHAAGIARERYGPGGLERARDRLLAELRGLLTPAERVRTVVVFDARGGGHSYRSTTHRYGIRIEYPASQYEADDRIERLIREHSAPRSLLVVSGDRRLHRAVHKRRGEAENSAAFLARMQRRLHDDPPAEEEKPEPYVPSEREVQLWTRRIHGDPDRAADRPDRSR